MSRQSQSIIGNQARIGNDLNRQREATTYQQMADQMRDMGITPPTPIKKTGDLNIKGTTTEADMAKTLGVTTKAGYSDAKKAKETIQTGADNSNTTTIGSGLHDYNKYFAVYQDNDVHIRPLHPAFHPMPSAYLHHDMI